MSTLTFIFIISGIVLIILSAQKLEKYSVLTASKYGMSPFLIGSTVIAFGTSAPEMFTSLFAAIDGKALMVVGNVVGSNVANIALVFGLTLGVLFFKKENFTSGPETSLNLIILIISTFIVCGVMVVNPFSIYSSLFLLSSLIVVILIWYKKNTGVPVEIDETQENFLLTKLFLSIASLVLAAWLITKGALNVLDSFGINELFVGYTVLAIGTSLPEIAASLALALKGRYSAVAGTLIGSNILNGLFVLAIPGLFRSSSSFDYIQWIPLQILLIIVTIFFSIYVFIRIKKPKRASLMVSFFFFISYLVSLSLAYN